MISPTGVGVVVEVLVDVLVDVEGLSVVVVVFCSDGIVEFPTPPQLEKANIKHSNSDRMAQIERFIFF